MRLGVDRGSGSRSSRSNSSSSSSRRRSSSSSGSSSSRSRSRSRRSPRCRPRRRRRSSRSRSRSRSSSNAAEVVVAEAEPPATIAVGVACYRFPPPPDVQREQHCVTDSKPTGNSADLRSWRSWLASVCSLDLSGFRWVWLLRGRCLGFRTLISSVLLLWSVLGLVCPYFLARGLPRTTYTRYTPCKPQSFKR